jgi:trehalose 2-sulfotransferase
MNRRRTLSEFQAALFDAGVARTYSIAFSMRSGSTWLCEMLAQLGLGRPTEYFQYPYEKNVHFQAIEEIDEIGQIVSLLGRNSVGGIFASKMTHDHRARLEETLRRNIRDYNGIESTFPNHKWIYLRRRQLVAQAISLYLAETSGNWGATGTSTSPGGYSEISYDFPAILANVMILAAHHVNWECNFSVRRREILEIYYEDLAATPHSVLDTIFNHLHLEGSGVDHGTIATTHKSISGLVPSVYGEMANRFTEDFLRIGQTDDMEHFGPSYARWLRFFVEKGWQQ